MSSKTQDLSAFDPHETKEVLGFWLYIMTDCILFATLFATYAVLHHNTAGGIGIKHILNYPFLFTETMLLLTSSFTYGLASIALKENRKMLSAFLVLVTFVCGVSFLAMEFHEFRGLVLEGNSWKNSAFLSAFFTLVGTHGLHVLSGLVWMFFVFWQIIFRKPSPLLARKMACLGLFWHFLDIIWIFVFTIVYLMGGI